jgi:hypothetical protein
MTMRFYDVKLESEEGGRTVRVSSPTGVQAGDAAAPLMKQGDRILSIEEVEDDGLQRADAPPPLSQAEELADVTPGAAAAVMRSSAHRE